MADINFNKLNDEQIFHKSTELLYFAYRDFISWPDDVLETYGFGRAHHRILYFVSTNPGMTVAELLKILNITKQSLSRVLGALIEQGYIDQKIGAEDRRQRLLFLSTKGKVLLDEVSVSQKASILKASQQVGPEAVTGFWKMLKALANEED
jgi:DNA-binding MarR family transcriptional regulator